MLTQHRVSQPGLAYTQMLSPLSKTILREQALTLASFQRNTKTCFAQIACSVELIQAGWVSVDNSPGLTQLPSCHPAQGTKRSSCPSICLLCVCVCV